MKARIIFILITAASISASSAGTAAEWFARGDTEEKKGNSRAALVAYLEAEKLDAKMIATVVKIAKQYGDLMTGAKNAGEREKLGQMSLAYSRKALAMDAGNSDAHLSMAISTGKLTEFMGAREKVEASRTIKMHADRALELAPKSDYAHHLLGRWHQEIAGMNGATRAFAKVIYGGVPTASYQEALDHFTRAKALRPDRLIHQIEYGRTLAMMGRKQEAEKELKRCLAKPSRDKDDDGAKARASESLGKL